MTTPTENSHASDTPLFDPFPEPSGYPSGWDLSDIAREEGPAAAAPAGDEAES